MTGTKHCTKCGLEKPFSDFFKRSKAKDGYATWCKHCYKIYSANWYANNIEHVRETHARYHLNNYEKNRARALAYAHSEHGIKKRREYYAKHKADKREYDRQYRAKNREHLREVKKAYYHANKEKVAIWKKRYKDNHKDELTESEKRYRQEHKKELNDKRFERLHSDPVFKLKEQLRCNIRGAFKRRGRNKTCRTADIVGCDLDFLCDYLFKTWENNYGKPWDGEPYHIDHIIPLATATTEEEVMKLCHYTNLQLLSPEDNMAKADNLKHSPTY